MTPSLRILAGSDNPGESGTKLLDRASAFTFLEPGRAAGPRKDAVAQIQHWNIDKEQGRQTQVELNSKAANELTKTPEGGSPETAIPLVTTEVNSATEFTTHDIFREYLDKFLIVYLDDILVFSDDWESHVKQVRMVFQVLRANSLFVKGQSVSLEFRRFHFWVSFFSPSTIEMDPVKVQAIHDWTQPTSVKSLQKFLGFANFYRRFISNFSSVAKPLTDLTKKGADVVNWSSAAVEAFQELKRRFSSAPVLCQPDVSLPFQVEVDASEIGAGAVLSQRSSDGPVMKPCAFFSRKFSPAERNYDVGNRELLAMKWAFEEWRHWLEGAKHRVVVLTDHKNLTYLESAKWLNPRQARWSLFFSRFDFVVSYLLGSKNVKADALSRSFVPDSPGVPEPAGILKEGVSSPKFKPRFIGPYKISEVLNPVSFRLTLPASFAIHNVFHRLLLRRYVAPVVPSVDPPAPVLVEGELEYVVEKILDSRISRWKLQYLVKWKGYGQEDNSWVFASDVHAADLHGNQGKHRGQVESSDCPGVDSVVDRLQQIWTQVVDNLTCPRRRLSFSLIADAVWDPDFVRKLQYLVKWKGYAQEDNSWVFASDVIHAPDLVRAFHVAHPACYYLLLEALRSKGVHRCAVSSARRSSCASAVSCQSCDSAAPRLFQCPSSSSSIPTFTGFVAALNNKNIRLTATSDSSSIEFQDVRLTRDRADTIQTTIYRNPTATNMLLHASSSHPAHMIHSVPIGQFLRIRRICSTIDEFEAQARELKSRFKERGYSNRAIKRAYLRAKHSDRNTLLYGSCERGDKSDIRFVTNFNSRAGAIRNALERAWPILRTDPTLAKLLPHRPLITYRRARIYVIILYGATTSWGGCRACGQCVACRNIVRKDTFVDSSGQKSLKIMKSITCTSKNVIYYASCPCPLIYVGLTTRQLKTRVREHVRGIEAAAQEMDIQSLKTIPRHFKAHHNCDSSVFTCQGYRHDRDRHKRREDLTTVGTARNSVDVDTQHHDYHLDMSDDIELGSKFPSIYLLKTYGR
ncbi:unnamed protein product [Ranitomeya imitator]|uniref:Chromo domain-containing protein n=1 Tax=Ranitomeya imitator TaxID=111125 RepID=A0ABN9MP52_9NEOB|nr:unnamed protein product [Ranitomeya imitator]